MEFVLELDGRVLVDTKVHVFAPGNLETTNYYDDGTEIHFIQKAGQIDVKSNRQLVLQSDGKTVKIV